MARSTGVLQQLTRGSPNASSHLRNAGYDFLFHSPPRVESLSWKESCEDKLITISEVQILLH